MHRATNRVAATPPRFTPKPPNDFPLVHYAMLDQPLHYLNPHTLTEWENAPHPKLLMQIFSFNGDPTSGRLPVQLGLARFHITSILESLADNQVHILPPTALPNASNPAPAPRSFLVHGMSLPHYERLLRHRIWSFQDITLHFMEFPINPKPLHVVSFTTLSPLPIQTILLATKTAWTDPLTTNRLAEILNEANHDTPTLQLLDVFLSSVTVEKFMHDPAVISTADATNRTTLYSITAADPFNNPTLWKKIRHLLQSIEYRNLVPTLAAKITKLGCPLCHGATHTAPTCPFPSTPLWYGPVHRTPKPASTVLNLGEYELDQALKRNLQWELDILHEIESIYA